VRIPLVSLPLITACRAGACRVAAGLAGVCLAGLLAACSSGSHPAGLAPAAPAPAGLASAGLASAGSAPAGLASAEGTLTGHLYGVGGPPPGAPRPWPGTVTLTGPGVHRDIGVGAGGRYSVRVPAGTYAVRGRSPLYQDGAAVCQAAGPATVTSGHRTEADVLCQLR
jgi:hypothetical protein